MKIRRNTPDMLIAEEIPWFVAIMLFFFTMTFVSIGIFLCFEGGWAGLIFGGIGGGMGFAGMCVFVERLQVILDRRANTVTIRRRTILNYRETKLPLSQVKRAETETTISSGESRQTLYRPSLVMADEYKDGAIVQPVTQVYSSGTGSTRLVDAINDWLKVNR